MILNKAQAEAVYSAMCALNNVGGQFDSIKMRDDVTITMFCKGEIKVDKFGSVEIYPNQNRFATAYGLD